MAKNNYRQGQGRNRGKGNQSPYRGPAVSLSQGQAIGTANSFGRLLTRENNNSDLLQSMVYTSGRTAGKTSNIDSFEKTGAKRLQQGKTMVKGHDATICFSNGSVDETVAIVQCKILGHQMIGDWKVFIPA